MKLSLILAFVLVSTFTKAEEFSEYETQRLICENDSIQFHVLTQKENCRGEVSLEVQNEPTFKTSRNCDSVEEDFSFIIEFGKEVGGKYNQHSGLFNNGTENVLFVGHIGDLIKSENGFESYRTDVTIYRFPPGEFLNGPRYEDVPCELHIKR